MNPDAIRERFTLRNAERTSLLASATAVALTTVMVGGGQASETNPVSAWLIGEIGIHAWALLTPLFIAGLFGLFRFTARKEPGLTRASAWFVATALFADATGNVIGTLAVGGPTAPVPWLSVSTVLALALVLSFRSELSTLAGLIPGPSVSTARAFGFALLIVLSAVLAPVSFDVSPVENATAAVDGAVEGFEDGEASDWSYISASTTKSAQGSYSGEMSAGGTAPDSSYSGFSSSLSEYNIYANYKSGNSQWHSIRYMGSGGNQYTRAGVNDLENIFYYSGGSAVDTGVTVPTGTWLEFKFQPDFGANSYTFTVTNAETGNQLFTKSGIGAMNADSSFGGLNMAHKPGYVDQISLESTSSLTEYYDVSGTVTDKDGNAISGASVSDGNGNSTTTASDGSYTLNLQNDTTYDITASNGGYVSQTNTVTVSGSAVTGNDYSLGGNLGGRMVNQNGEPVANGTVEVWGVNYSEINPDASQTLEERARELIENSSDPLPDEWDPTRQLAGSSGAWSNADGKYVGVYEDTDIGTAPWVDSADLSPNLQVPAGEPVKFVVADPTAGSGYLDNEYDRQIPGRVVGGDSVKIEQLSPDGSATDVTTVEIDQSAGGGLLDPSSLEYGSTNLPPGIYRASVEDSPFELVFTVGSPQDLAAAFQKDLESDAGDLTQRAKDIRNRVSSNKFERITTTTGPDGYWSAPVTGKNVDRVAVQGYKGPYDLMGTAPENATLSDLNAVYESTTGYNGSVASPAGVSQTDLPNHDLTVRTVETTGPRHPNLREYDNLTMSFLGLLENETFANMVRANLNMSDSDVSKVNSQLTELRQSNAELQARYDELRAQRENTTGTAPTNETENRLLRQAIQELRGELQPEEPDTSYNNGTVSATIPWNGELDADTVAVVAHLPGSGTSEPVPDEYVSVNKRMGQGDTVEVNDYPVPEGSPMVSFSVTVNGEDGESIGDTTIPARNPNFNGRMMDLDSMSISTLKPGPSEQVRIGFNPSDTSAQIKRVDASVEGPNGPLTVTNGDTNKTVKFTTDGQGDYYGTVDITDKSGNTWTEGFTLRAGSRETNRPPSVRVRDGVTGQFAVVGDGLTDGSVNTNNGIASLTAVAKEAPGNVHFYTSQISNNYGKTEVNIMKDGPTGAETASKHVQVYLHTGDLKENAVIYRNDNEPLAVGESTGFGSVTCDGESDGCTIKSYTDAGGTATFTINNNPTFVSRTLHWARLNIPVDLPGLFVFPVPDGIPMDMGSDAFHFQSVGIDTADIATLPSPGAVAGGVTA